MPRCTSSRFSPNLASPAMRALVTAIADDVRRSCRRQGRLSLALVEAYLKRLARTARRDARRRTLAAH